jgi:RNA polymerase sigma-70 factor, ECF subfamily
MGGGNSSEAKLIEAASSGNRGAFAELVRTYRTRVLRAAYGVVGSMEEADDVAQEVFIKVWDSLPSYHAQGTFMSWLYRITINTAIDVLRRRRDEVALDDLQYAAKDPPEEAVVRQEGRRQVRRAIAALPPVARATLILREYEQLSYKEIAEVQQIPIGTVMSRLNYARQLLKKALAPQRLEGNQDATSR